MKTTKKLIEVALPLAAINKACAREKSIRHGHPSTLHLWWARRPLAAARAVIFAQMVDDPSAYVDVLRGDPMLRRKAEAALKARLKLWDEACILAEEAKVSGLPIPEPGPAPTLDDMLADHERQRLFRIIEDLVLWENTTNETVLQAARDEIWQSWRRACAENADHPLANELFDRKKLPAFHDPFAGGGALPLEAQRLGLESYASDLNPVAVLINKAMIEIPPEYSGKAPVNSDARSEKSLMPRQWNGAQGLAEDVRYYGEWMRDEAEKRIGHLYPKIEITAEMAGSRPDLTQYVGRKLTVIAWLWARTVKSPNPAFAQVDVPLASTFILSTKAGKEAYVEPVLESGGYRFTVKTGRPKHPEAAKSGTSAGKRQAFNCLMSGVPMGYEHIRAEARAGRMGARLMTIVAEGDRARVYLSPTSEHQAIASEAEPEWKPDCEMPKKHRNFQPPVYGMNNLGDIFTPRQLVALTTFSDLVQEARERVRRDAVAVGLPDDAMPMLDGGTGATAYADAVAVYLAFAVSKTSNRSSSICTFKSGVQCPGDTFGRQALAMSWDYAEANIVCGPSGSFQSMVKNTVAGLLSNDAIAGSKGHALQQDASIQSLSAAKIVSTDPPYYDNIAYADLSDFFYVCTGRGYLDTKLSYAATP